MRTEAVGGAGQRPTNASLRNKRRNPSSVAKPSPLGRPRSHE